MKKIVTLLLTLTMLLSIGTTALAVDAPSKSYPQRFYDVPKDHWAFGYIAELVDRGVLAGYEDGSFKPEATVSRAEFAKIMVGAAGVQTNDNSVYFNDMQNHWAIPYVNAAKDYLTAYADNTYRPNQAAVREDVTMAMVKLKGYDVSTADFSYTDGFTDNSSISNNVKKYVAVAVEKGLISGFEDSTFRGQATLTRAEAATLLWRAFQYGSDNKVVDNVTQPITATTPPTTQNTQTEPIQTQATPTPTENPVATVEPTDKPTSEVTPQSTEKPYKIETVAKANVANDKLYTYDYDNIIYYVEDNKIWEVGVGREHSETPNVVYDLNNLSISNEYADYTGFIPDSICVDNNTETLYILGRYSYSNVAIGMEANNHFLYAISRRDDDALSLVTDSFYDKADYIVSVLSTGDFAVMSDTDRYSGIVDSTGSKLIKQLNITTAVEEGYDGNLVYIGYSRPNEYVPYTYNFSAYDFVNSTKRYDIGSDISCIGVDCDRTVFIRNNVLYVYNYNGKLEGTIEPSDCKVADKRVTEFSDDEAPLVSFTASGKMMFPDDGFIFYDETNTAFRRIGVNY